MGRETFYIIIQKRSIYNFFLSILFESLSIHFQMTHSFYDTFESMYVF